jgi:hypothetical protein
MGMIRHIIKCLTCARSEIHGSAAPEHVQSCHTARMMRSACREGVGGCDFCVLLDEYEPSDIDALRLGMREDRPCNLP